MTQGGFSFPCIIGSYSIDKALADRGSSINIMSYHMSKKLGLGGPKLSSRICINFADKSIRHPRGVVEDVLVKVKDLVFVFNFVILDMEEDIDFPLILG